MFSGSSGHSLAVHHGMPFTSRDQNSGNQGGHNCAIKFKGAWWYKRCHRSNLNGLYLRGNHSSFADGMNWFHWKGHHYSLTRIAMKIIPVDFWTVMLIAQKWNSTNLTKKYLNTWFCRIGQLTVNNNNNHNSKTNLIYIAAYIKSSSSMACIIMAIMPPIFRKSRKSNGISWSLLMWIVERRTNQLTSVENDAWANFIIATLANLTTPFSNSHNKLAIYVNRKSNVDLSQTAFQLRGVTQSHRRSICGKLGASLGPSS